VRNSGRSFAGRELDAFFRNPAPQARSAAARVGSATDEILRGVLKISDAEIAKLK